MFFRILAPMSYFVWLSRHAGAFWGDKFIETPPGWVEELSFSYVVVLNSLNLLRLGSHFIFFNVLFFFRTSFFCRLLSIWGHLWASIFEHVCIFLHPFTDVAFLSLFVSLYLCFFICFAFLGLVCLAWRCLPLLALLVVFGVVQRCLFFAWCYLALLGFVDVACLTCLAWHCLTLLGTVSLCFALLALLGLADYLCLSLLYLSVR